MSNQKSLLCHSLAMWPREGNGTPRQYSCLENPMNGRAWWAAVHGVTESQTWLSDFTFTFHSYALEKEMATHSSVLALRIPETGEPGGLPSMGSHSIWRDWSDLAAAAAAMWPGAVQLLSWSLFYYYEMRIIMYSSLCGWNEIAGGKVTLDRCHICLLWIFQLPIAA